MSKKRFKFRNIEDLEGVADGYITAGYFFYLTSDDFKKEKDLKNFLVSNLSRFCMDNFNDVLVSFEVEKHLGVNLNNSRQIVAGKKVDIYAVCERDTYVIEIKAGKQPAQQRPAIGQILNYGRCLPGAKMVIVTSLFDRETQETISHYNLPIHYIYMDKKRTLRLANLDSKKGG